MGLFSRSNSSDSSSFYGNAAQEAKAARDSGDLDGAIRAVAHAAAESGVDPITAIGRIVAEGKKLDGKKRR